MTVFVLALSVPRPGHAQPADAAADADADPVPTTASAAVRQARNAFEYRDFERVVKLLRPWLHPRRILDRALATEARHLLGVSQHVLGRTEEANEEFAELLLLDPRYKLDPFLVPPAVIQAFEDVRSAMQPTLDEILRAQGVEPESSRRPGPPNEVRAVELPPLAIAWLPGGLPQFAADEPGWGLLWAVLQVGFLTLNLVAFDQAGRNDGGGFDMWTSLQFVGLGGFIGTWTASGIQGYGQLQETRARILGETPLVDPSMPLEPRATLNGPSVVLGWEF